MADTAALPLRELMASLDTTCLPKTLQVCSGVYFQGSVYDISGCEVCFSTGDVIKVIEVDLLSVCCRDTGSDETFELSINHRGLFAVVTEETPYSTIEEMVSPRPVGLEPCLPFTFISGSKMTVGNFTLGAGRPLTALSVEQHRGLLRCHVDGQQEASADVSVPLSCPGEFRQCFTLREIMSSPGLRHRWFRLIDSSKCERKLALTPVYWIHAMMHLRKDVVQFSSTLEVDVIDVSELYKDVHFLTPISLTEVLCLPGESFPTAVEILEGPGTLSLFKCSWVRELRPGRHLVFHKTGPSTMILLSSLKSQKTQQHFLVSQQYGGRFRRRPREFDSVYELYAASIKAPALKFGVMRNCEEVEEDGLPALFAGEQLEVVRWERMELPCENATGQKRSVEALLCKWLQEPDDEDEDDEEDERAEILLPLYMQGHFVEVLADKRKYRLTHLAQEFSFPMDVKVVSRDAQLEDDPLAGFACLRIAGSMSEPVIQASFPHTPDRCFEIPTKWLSMSVCRTQDPLPWPDRRPPVCHVDRVTEVTDVFFHEFLKLENSAAAAPPPRPPKRSLPSSESRRKEPPPPPKAPSPLQHRPEESLPTGALANLTLSSQRRPQTPPAPDILDTQPAAVVSQKHSVAVKTQGSRAPPNLRKTKKKSAADG